MQMGPIATRRGYMQSSYNTLETIAVVRSLSSRVTMGKRDSRLTDENPARTCWFSKVPQNSVKALASSAADVSLQMDVRTDR